MWSSVALLVSVLALVLLGDRVAAQTSGTPIGDWIDIRGTNYVVNSAQATNNIHMWLAKATLNGEFDQKIVDQEMATLRLAGLNSIRLFGSFYAHAADRLAYLSHLALVLDACRRNRIYVTYCVWDGFGVDGLDPALLCAMHDPRPLGPRVSSLVSGVVQQARSAEPTLPANMGGVWFASPGNAFLKANQDPTLWPAAIRNRANAYLDDVANLFNSYYSDVFLSYDLINEPDNALYLVAFPYRQLISASANLCAYSMSRLTARHARAKYTVGTASPLICLEIHRDLMQNHNGAKLDYLSYHDYYTPDQCLGRAQVAKSLAALEQLEVVCSEFHTASRQGQLLHLLRCLQQEKIGGQMWGAIRERIFVVRFADAFRRLYPSTPTRWWAYDSGIYRPVPDATKPSGLRYDPVGAAKANALKDWGQNRPLGKPIWPTLTVARTTPPQPNSYTVTVRGPANLSAILLWSRPTSRWVKFPGFGFNTLDGATVRQVSLGNLVPTQNDPQVGVASLQIQVPPTAAFQSVVLQGLVGTDYNLQQWDASIATSATAPVVITP